jgi:hypothetical protein
MTISDIIESVTEQDSYRRDAEIKRRIYEWAASKLPAVQLGYQREITSVDYETGEAQFVDVADSVIAEQAAQARLLDFQSKGLHFKASKFRSLMQSFFGPDAELDRTKTADFVTYYFMNATGLSGDQVRDGIFLKELFAELSAWNGGETWTLFEGPTKDVIP